MFRPEGAQTGEISPAWETAFALRRSCRLRLVRRSVLRSGPSPLLRSRSVRLRRRSLAHSFVATRPPARSHNESDIQATQAALCWAQDETRTPDSRTVPFLICPHARWSPRRAYVFHALPLANCS